MGGGANGLNFEESLVVFGEECVCYWANAEVVFGSEWTKKQGGFTPREHQEHEIVGVFFVVPRQGWVSEEVSKLNELCRRRFGDIGVGAGVAGADDA